MTIRLKREQVPEPPADAPRLYGDPPYQSGGYVIDDGRSRWRYDDKGLKLYIEWLFGEDRRKVGSFAAFWEREDYGRRRGSRHHMSCDAGTGR